MNWNAYRWSRSAWMAAVAVCLGATPALAQRGVGPFVLRSGNNAFNVRLIKRQSDTLWISRQNQQGVNFEAGIPMADITVVEVPRPRAFDLAELAVASNQIVQAREGVRTISDMLKPFRDVPGVPADEALYQLGRLSEKEGRIAEALVYYEDIIKQSYASPMAARARMRAGLSHERVRNHEKALEYLNAAVIPDDDVELLSEALFAKGQANAALRRFPEAIESYLYLVVFYPYAQSNEVRCLEAVLPCYAEIKDWDALYKTIQIIKTSYPGSREAAMADEYAAEHNKELTEEKPFQEKP
ncbi:MAG: tetratricopeptide repeat protein [Lentisphaerota bacterium]